MPNYRRQFQPGGTFFFTLVTCRQHRLFADSLARACLRDAIRTVQADLPFDLTAIVLLPNHLHCIWRLPPQDSDIPRAGHALNGSSASGGLRPAGITWRYQRPGANIVNTAFGKSASGNIEFATRAT